MISMKKGSHHTEETRSNMKLRKTGWRGKSFKEIFGEERTKEISLKLSQHNGKYWSGKRHSEETKKKISESKKTQYLERPDITERIRGTKFLRGCHLGINNSFYGKHHTEQTKCVLRRFRATQKFDEKPTRPERLMIDLIRSAKLPFAYVGDGKVWINARNPDFISTDKSRKIIEVFGDHWHNLGDDYLRTEEGRKAHFAKHGFETLVIWEHELTNIENVLTKIMDFNNKEVH